MRLRADGFPRSLHGRLLILLLPTLGAVLAFNLWSDFRAAREYTREPYDQALADTAVALAAHIQVHDRVLSLDLSPQAALTLRARPFDDLYYVVRGPNGAVVTGQEDLPPPSAPFVQSPSFYDATYRGAPVRVVLYRTATALGEVTVQAAQTTRRRDELTRRFVSEDLLQDSLLVAATLVLVLLGVRYGLRPLLRVRADLEQRPSGDLRALQETDVPSEVRPLVHALNQQLRALRQASEAQQNFLANAAHQLRTPLAGLQTQIEVAAQEQDPQRLREDVAGLLASVRRASHLANQLLALARAQPPASLSHGTQSIDLKEIMVDSASVHFDRAVANDVDLRFETGTAPLHGSKWLIRELAANLIDNALTYTPPGGNVTVRCGVKAHRPFLEVEDTGPGIPASEQARVFERFYRLPGSAGEGSGLGLAIVKEIATTHAATIAITQPERGGACITVTFPSCAKT
ncbi:MAG: sensor histidine kinase [Proteobacteria bacterium]|nr:MAG: sensor histidine kinase [Pseudomonadota bacterium]